MSEPRTSCGELFGAFVLFLTMGFLVWLMARRVDELEERVRVLETSR